MTCETEAELAGSASSTISRRALLNELGDLGPAASLSISRAMKRSKGKIAIPRHENLSVGDVILSRPINKQIINIESHQRGHRRSAEGSRWTHAMLYIGNLHVLESNPPRLRDPRNGVRISPLINSDDANREYLILRHTSEQFDTRRYSMVRRALLDYHLKKQKYDIRAASDAFLYHLSGRRRAPRLHLAANCSEYILSCYAIGAETLVSEFVQVNEDPQNFFFPADLFDHQSFRSSAMDFYEIEE